MRGGRFRFFFGAKVGVFGSTAAAEGACWAATDLGGAEGIAFASSFAFCFFGGRPQRRPNGGGRRGPIDRTLLRRATPGRTSQCTNCGRSIHADKTPPRLTKNLSLRISWISPAWRPAPLQDFHFVPTLTGRVQSRSKLFAVSLLLGRFGPLFLDFQHLMALGQCPDNALFNLFFGLLGFSPCSN